MNIYNEPIRITAAHQYHIVFAPRNRRRIFNIEGVAQRLTELVSQICYDNNMNLLGIDFAPDYCHLLISAPPNLGPKEIWTRIRIGTGKVLRTEFEELSACKQLWTMKYLSTTAEVLSQEDINEYLMTIPKRSAKPSKIKGEEPK